MGSTAHCSCAAGRTSVVDWAVGEVARLEDLWSRFRPGSDVGRCNVANGEPVGVAPETLDLVERAIELWSSTGGRFDPTVLRALEANGYDETFERVRAREHATPRRGERARQVAHRCGFAIPEPSAPAAVEPVATPGCAGVVVCRSTSTVTLPSGAGLDLGGVGKGYAADLVAGGLVARGARGACVALGGDVRADGRRARRRPLVDPGRGSARRTRRLLLTHPLGDAAIVTSTRLFRRWVHGGRARHHIIDPATGAPADSGVAAVVVVDREAWRAEGWPRPRSSPVVRRVARCSNVTASKRGSWRTRCDRARI